MEFDFELVLGDSPYIGDPDGFLDKVTEPLFDIFQGDVTPGMCGGLPILYCTVDAATLENAKQRVLDVISHDFRLSFIVA